MGVWAAREVHQVAHGERPSPQHRQPRNIFISGHYRYTALVQKTAVRELHKTGFLGQSVNTVKGKAVLSERTACFVIGSTMIHMGHG